MCKRWTAWISLLKSFTGSQSVILQNNTRPYAALVIQWTHVINNTPSGIISGTTSFERYSNMRFVDIEIYRPKDEVMQREVLPELSYNM